MQILFVGEEPKPKTQWWVGMALTCGFCHTVVRLEAGDPVATTMERRPHGVATLSVECPTCKYHMTASAAQ